MNYFLIFLTLLVAVVVEKIEEFVAIRFFSSYVLDIARMEAEIEEYKELSILAMLSGDRDAYRGFQDMMNEIYGRVFFRKIAFFTPLYFLLLSPYIVALQFLGVANSLSVVLPVAVLYFSAKLFYGMARDFVKSYMDYRKVRN